MIRFSKEKVKLLHKFIAQETGGSNGIPYIERLFSMKGRSIYILDQTDTL